MVKTGRPALPADKGSFGDQLREARKACGYQSAKAFADALQVERPTVNRWESNIIVPPPLAMAMINQLLGTNFPVIKKSKKGAAKKMSQTATVRDATHNAVKVLAEKSVDVMQPSGVKTRTKSVRKRSIPRR